MMFQAISPAMAAALRLQWSGRMSRRMADYTSPTYWTMAPTICFVAITIAVSILVSLLWVESSKPERQNYAASVSVYDIGFEYQRLLLSAKRNESLKDVKLRGEIFLSRVSVLRDAPVLRDVRGSIAGSDLSALYVSAGKVARFLDWLEQPNGRAVLLRQLRADEAIFRPLINDVIHRERGLWIDSRAKRQSVQTKYMLTILALLAALVIARFIINLKLREASQTISTQLATREGILASVDAAIIGIGAQGEVLYSNRNALDLLGRCARSGSRPARSGAQSGTLLGEIAAMLQEGLGDGSAVHHDTRKIRVENEGVVRHYVIRTSPGQSAASGGAEASLILVITDVTSEEEATLRREEYDVKLGEASRILAYAAMSGGIVHEISQPLAAMRNYVYALKGLRDHEPGKKPCPLVEQLGVEIDRAIEVVRSIRQMGPQNDQENGNCDALEVITHSIRLVSLGSSPTPPIRVASTGGPVVITGSLPIIGQVVVNLLKNALSASAAAGRQGASVDVTVGDGVAEIAVTDFGTGVSESAAKCMFAPFTRSSRGGMGLGLAICQRIATGLGGSLSWENSGTAGAVFRFRVPLAPEPALQ